MSLLDRLLVIVAPVVDSCGVQLFDAEYRGGSLVLLVDEPGGINADRLAQVTRAVSQALDESDPVPGRYTLEVSSPGVERPLRTALHFAGALGEIVNVKTKVDINGQRRFVGQLVESGDDSGVIVESAGGRVELRYDQIDKARTVFEWGPGPKPGKAPKGDKPDKPDKAPKGDKAAKVPGVRSESQHDDDEGPSTPDSPDSPVERVAAGSSHRRED